MPADEEFREIEITHRSGNTILELPRQMVIVHAHSTQKHGGDNHQANNSEVGGQTQWRDHGDGGSKDEPMG